MKISTLFCGALIALAPVAANACKEHEMAAAKTAKTEKTAKACCAKKGVKTVSLSTPKIHCAGCKDGIESSLKKMKGVQTISTDIETKTVKVSYDGAKVSQHALMQEMNRIGFPATLVVETKANAKVSEKSGANAEPMACCKKPDSK